ncbi:MAG: hypothetical protein V1794_14845 [Candidatus Glassbacteria bacterium]
MEKIVFECSGCGWRGSAQEAMNPDPEVREDWEEVWRFRKGLEKEFGTQFYLGTVKWEDDLIDDLVCPKCAGEATRVREE